MAAVSDVLDTFRRAQEHLLAGEPGVALDLLASIADDDRMPFVQGAIGVALHLLGRPDEAIPRFAAAIEVERAQLAMLHYNHGAALAAAMRLDEAASAYVDALAMQPTLQVALVNLAVVRQAQGRPRDAEHALRAALSRDPDDLNARYNLGAVLCAQSRFAEAEAELRAAQGASGAIAGLASALSAQGKHAEAIPLYREAVAAEPDRADTYRGLAAGLLVENQADEALTMAERAVALAPDDLDALDILGSCLAAVGRFDDAIARYRGVLERDPARVATYANLGTVLVRHDDPPGAVEAFEAGLHLDAEHRGSRIGLAGAYARAGRTDDAIATYRALLVREPDNPGWAHMIAALSGENPAMPPDGYIARVFDSYANQFEEHLTGKLGYTVPQLLRDAVAPRARFAAALDLGCGTGLLGVELRPMADVLHGVDLSPKMIEHAQAKGIYDALTVAELVAHLDAATEPRYALITAADVMCYLGDLAPAIAAARRRLAPGGVLAFSVERDDDAEFLLRPTGRYAHGRAYLERLAGAHDLTLAGCEPVTLRYEHDAPVHGWLCTMVAPGVP